MPEIEDGPQPTISIGNEKVAAVKAWLSFYTAPFARKLCTLDRRTCEMVVLYWSLNNTSEVGWLYVPLLFRFWLFALCRPIGVWYLKTFCTSLRFRSDAFACVWIDVNGTKSTVWPISTVRAIESRWLLMLSNRSCSTVLWCHTTIGLRSAASGWTKIWLWPFSDENATICW